MYDIFRAFNTLIFKVCVGDCYLDNVYNLWLLSCVLVQSSLTIKFVKDF